MILDSLAKYQANIGSQDEIVTSSPIEYIFESNDNLMEKDLDQAIEVISADNLKGWQLYYIDTPGQNQGTLISGETRIAQSIFLKHYLGVNSLSCSIPSESILNAIERDLGLYNTENQNREKKEIKGIEYFKIRRAGVRIFYYIDKESKSIELFVYQKKQHRYRL